MNSQLFICFGPDSGISSVSKTLSGFGFMNFREFQNQLLVPQEYSSAEMQAGDTTQPVYIYIYIYGQASGVPAPPPQGWRVRRVVWPVGCGAAVGGNGSQRGPGSYASPAQARNLMTWGVFLFLLTLTCT